MNTAAILALLLVPLLMLQENKSVQGTHTPETRIQLVGGTGRTGRVQVYDVDRGRWYYVCDDSYWSTSEARVACRQLGYCSDGGSTYSESFESTYYKRIGCNGGESDLESCHTFTDTFCSTAAVAVVNCELNAPNRPQSVSITIINSHSLEMSWTTPSLSECRDSISGYRTTCTASEPVCPERSDTSSITYKNVYIGSSLSQCNYRCCVNGYNNAGDGLASCASLPVPNSPESVQGTALNSTSIRITWSRPSSNYYHITGYRVYQCSYPCSIYQDTLSTLSPQNIDFSSLSAYTQYSFLVKAQSVAGLSASSTSVSVRTDPDYPTRPRSVRVTGASSTSLRITWTVPQYLNGDFRRYTVDGCGSGSSISVLTTTYTITGLNVYQRYTCCVKVVTHFNESQETCSSGQTLLAPPSAPTTLQLHYGLTSTSVSLSWSGPSTTYNQPYTFFLTCNELYITDPQNKAADLHSSTRNYAFDNLQPGAQYKCCVIANNDAGDSSPQCIDIKTDDSAPTGPPTQLRTASINATTVELSWSEPRYRERNGRIQWYSVRNCQKYPEPQEPLECTHNQRYHRTRIQLTLHPNYHYNWSVSAYTVGYGPYSDWTLFQMPEDRPSGPPESVSVGSVGPQSIKLIWRPPALQNQNGNITAYRVKVFSSSGAILNNYTTQGERITITALQEASQYTFQVSAMTSVGEGPYQVYGPVTTSIGIKYGSVIGMTLLVLLLLTILTVAVVFCVCQKRQRELVITTDLKTREQDQEHVYSGQSTLGNVSVRDCKQEDKLKTPAEVTVKQKITTFAEIKNWFSQLRNKGDDDIELPQLPARRYLKDVEFTKQLSEEPPEIPARLYLENGSISSLMDEDTPVAASHRSYHRDKLFAEGLENFVASLSSQTPQPEKEEKIYQPLIPARRYEGGADEETSVYQSLTQNRVKGGMQGDPSMVDEAKVVNNSEGHYQPLLKQAKPGNTVNNSEGHYQPLLKRAEPSCYERVTPNGKDGAHGNNSEGVYQSLTKRDEPSHYQALTVRAK